ncbi:hypothetical protein [Flavobacterium sp. WC2509]|uniref:hypothetical protein n=1 Tax=Flavobacterium sp. WC2509 TaxID=3461406 RepID=UPI0040446647
MNQINSNIIPPIEVGIIKKAVKISWASDDGALEKNAVNNNIRFHKDYKKKK